jgi:hypothetical protein
MKMVPLPAAIAVSNTRSMLIPSAPGVGVADSRIGVAEAGVVVVMAVVRAAGAINSWAEIKSSGRQALRTDHNNKTAPRIAGKALNAVFTTGND